MEAKADKTADRIILGIDPGTNIMGYGVLGIRQSKPFVMGLGVLDLHKMTDGYLKLQHIFNETCKLIDLYLPDELAIEAPFFGKNVQSMLKLGRAQGVAIAAALSRSLPIAEYAPRKIKMSITGMGAASKEQVASMLSIQLNFTMEEAKLDATDGLAAAMCHFNQKKISPDKPGARSWGEYVRKNPGKVK